MKIDSHQHYWCYKPHDFAWIGDDMAVLKQDFFPADCLSNMNASGITATVAVQARSVEHETDDLLKLARSNPGIVGVVGWTDLRSARLPERLEHWRTEPLLRGFRHILQDEPDVSVIAEDTAFNKGVEQLQQCGLTYDVLVRDHQMASVMAFCARHDRHWLVLDHLGKPAIRDWPMQSERESQWAEHLHLLSYMPHVMCKLSGAVTETAWNEHPTLRPLDERLIFSCFDQALEFFGPRRIMFGSDWPVCQLASSYPKVTALAQAWAESRLLRHEQVAFWSDNAIRAYGLTERKLAQLYPAG